MKWDMLHAWERLKLFLFAKFEQKRPLGRAA
jgi:hypothetical protein